VFKKGRRGDGNKRREKDFPIGRKTRVKSDNDPCSTEKGEGKSYDGGGNPA